jgi:hypothetical protein
MYLHEDREIFKNTIEDVANSCGRLPAVIEKDYYVTLILRLLSEQLGNCVFKGGTSLSKGFHAIDRFSEDIDITFDEHIGESRRKKLKNVTLKGISDQLGLSIANWDETQSDRDYNAYLFAYDSVFDLEDDRMPQYVKLETALGSYSFPTQVVEISSFIGDYLTGKEREDVAATYSLDKFSMKLQSIDRTYIDKVFALCDYYLKGKSKRYSRHLYDIYKLSSRISFDDDFEKLINEVRNHRAQLEICPSAKAGVDVSALLLEICDTDFYKDDYNTITEYFAADFISYEEVIKNLRKLAERKIFA